MVYLVGAGPGDPGLITLRGIECLSQAEVVIYDRLANRSLLAHASHAELFDVGKRPDCHPVPQASINALLVEKAQAGKIVVRLKGGDPFVFGRGGEEATVLAAAGIAFEVVPGVTSAVAGPAYAGIPVTYRGMACSVAFITGHRADFAAADPRGDWRRLANAADTLVFLMGIAHLPAIVEQLLAGGRPPDTPVAIIREATTASQRTVVGRLADIVERAAGIQPPALIVVGEVVGLRDTLRWFDQPDRRPLWGVRVLNTRPGDQAAELSRRLAALGAEPVELPTTQIVPVADPGPLDRAIQHLLAGDEPHTRYDWIIFTSATAVTFFMNRLFELGHDARLLAGVRLGVVGQATADALRPYGLAADFLPSRQTGRDMAAEIGDVAGRRVLLPRSDMALPDSADILARRGAHVEPVVAYRVCPAEPDAPALAALLDGSIHVVTFFSPSALTGLAGMLGEQPLAQVLAGPAVACIGPTTAAAARQLGVRVDVVTQHASLDGLVDALVDWHARQIKG
jgi:uroporphyrinogen III methyltransferase/synthase